LKNNNYIIEVVGSQNDGVSEDEIKLTTTGSFVKDHENYYISYLEGDDFGAQDTTTTVHINSEKINIIRDGGVKSKLTLQKGKRHLCAYETGVGHLMVGICAENINSELNAEGGNLYFSYAMDINSEFASTNHIHIRVRPSKREPVFS